ncbi:MAG: hypothetical protein OEM41_04940 [Ignavibacteria bacterium]|nr:hypothetical protein [Ignavibacteria bacterium]
MTVKNVVSITSHAEIVMRVPCLCDFVDMRSFAAPSKEENSSPRRGTAASYD